jgi:hypothetical protein
VPRPSSDQELGQVQARARHRRHIEDERQGAQHLLHCGNRPSVSGQVLNRDENLGLQRREESPLLSSIATEDQHELGQWGAGCVENLIHSGIIVEAEEERADPIMAGPHLICAHVEVMMKMRRNLCCRCHEP